MNVTKRTRKMIKTGELRLALIKKKKKKNCGKGRGGAVANKIPNITAVLMF